MTRKPSAKKTTSPALGQSILRGIRQAVAFEAGQLDEAVEVFHVPAEVDVRRIRRRCGLSQSEFASRYGFNRRSLQDWEQGRRMPDSAARAYLMVISKNRRAVDEALFQQAS